MSNMNTEPSRSIKLFESKQIRTVWNETDQKWYFSVQDVVEVLTDSSDVKQYIKRILSRDEMLKSNWGTICTLVEMVAADGRKRKVQAANAQGLLRIIQSKGCQTRWFSCRQSKT